MIMDSLGALALATEKPNLELLERPPYRRDEYIISRKMVKHILASSIY
jgi:Ca2+-transporting ATPase